MGLLGEFFGSIKDYNWGEVAADVGDLAKEYGGTVIQTAGMAAQTGAQIQQARAQAREGEEAAKIIDTETALEKEALRRKQRQVISRNRAASAAAGVDPFSGSSLEMELSNAFEAGLNEELVGYAGAARSNLLRRGAKYTRSAIPGMATGGLASIGGKWWEKTMSP